MSEKNHWQLIAAQDYTAPTAPTVVRMQRQWRRLLRMLGLVKSEALPLGEVQAMADAPDFSASALQAALTHYLTTTQWSHALCVLLDPPFSGTQAMAQTWAKQQQRPQLIPPTRAQILDVDINDWWQQQSEVVRAHAQQSNPENAWLLADMTAYFLRSAQHLAFIRAWLPRALAGEFGAGVLVCNSWAFAFLSQDWPHRLASSHCLAPATPKLLRQLGFSGKDRQLARLMGEARGNLGVAWAVWHSKYQQQQPLPDLPLSANDDTGFILYSLLIHNGLKFEELVQVLPHVGSDGLKLQLLSLQSRGIIDCESSRQWQVTVLAYTRVREFLGGRDYLLDDF